MPCRDYEPPWGRGHPDYDRLHKLTRMLCGLCGRVEKLIEDSTGKPVTGSSLVEALEKDNELYEWWKEHQEKDRKREADKAEAKRQKEIARKARAKLSDEELEVLGLPRKRKRL